MKKLKILLVIVVVLAVLSLSAWMAWKVSFLEDKNAYIIEENEQLKTEKKQLQADKNQLENDKEELKNKNKQLKNEIKKFEDNMYKKALDDIFWKHGTYIAPEGTEFYSDPGCNTKVLCTRFITDIWIFYGRYNEYEVYMYWSTDGFVYSPDKVTFQEE